MPRGVGAGARAYGHERERRKHPYRAIYTFLQLKGKPRGLEEFNRITAAKRQGLSQPFVPDFCPTSAGTNVRKRAFREDASVVSA
jgi:hypothetical protein